MRNQLLKIYIMRSQSQHSGRSYTVKPPVKPPLDRQWLQVKAFSLRDMKGPGVTSKAAALQPKSHRGLSTQCLRTLLSTRGTLCKGDSTLRGTPEKSEFDRGNFNCGRDNFGCTESVLLIKNILYIKRKGCYQSQKHFFRRKLQFKVV